MNSRNFAGIEQEAEWNHAFSEELCVPVPDLYPELSDSLANLQHRDTEQDQMAKGLNLLTIMIHAISYHHYSYSRFQCGFNWIAFPVRISFHSFIQSIFYYFFFVSLNACYCAYSAPNASLSAAWLWDLLLSTVRNEDEDNVQCVPNTFDDHGLEADNNNPGTSQVLNTVITDIV